ncbi:MAG TPA: endonuclease/exonuclease/phosphatase family protein [Pirellulales bacterium]|nr:endonuclease/exonuclease/phosphatase family protein [Pirellulales bacterium]
MASSRRSRRGVRIARKTGWGVLHVLALALVALTVATFFARSSWMVELTTHFRAHYAMLLAIAAVVYGFARRWVMTAVAGVFAIVNFWVVVPYYVPGNAPRSNMTAKPLRVALAALHADADDHEPALRYFRTLKADLFVVTEVTPEWSEELKALEGFKAVQTFPRSTDGQGLAVLSHLPLADVTTEESPSGIPVLIAHLTFERTPITVIGAHPTPPWSEHSAAQRNEALEHLAHVVNQQSGPVIVLGDLNTTSWSPYFADLLRETGLVDSRLGRGIQPTWYPSTTFVAPEFVRIPLDHCLISEGIGVSDRRLGPFLGSDHLPIELRLMIPSKAAPVAEE